MYGVYEALKKTWKSDMDILGRVLNDDQTAEQNLLNIYSGRSYGDG